MAVTDTTITVEQAAYDGWIAAQTTWVYNSATSVVMDGDYSNIFVVGDKVKFTQSSTLKFFYVFQVEYVSLSDTTILYLHAGTDYVVSNTAITANYYSKVNTPFGFPDFGFNEDLDWNGSVSNPDIGNGVFTATAKLTGTYCDFDLTVIGGSTTNWGSGGYTFQLPFTAFDYGSSYAVEAFRVSAGNTGTLKYALDAYVESGTAILSFTALSDTAPFTFGDTDTIRISITYRTSL